MPTDHVLFVLLGLAAGFLSGMLGVGGGIIMVPLLFLMFLGSDFGVDAAMQVAVATSLAVAACTMLWSAWKHRRAGNVDADWARRLAPGAWGGALLGAIAGTFAKPLLLILAVAMMQCFAAWAMIFKARVQALFNSTRPQNALPQGAVIGVLSSLTGIAGGVLVTPYLIAKGEEPRRAVGTSTVIGTGIALFATIGYMLATLGRAPLDGAQLVGLVHAPAFLGMVVGSFVAVPAGVWAMSRMPGDVLRRVLAGVLLVSAAKMAWTPFHAEVMQAAHATAQPSVPAPPPLPSVGEAFADVNVPAPPVAAKRVVAQRRTERAAPSPSAARSKAP